MKSVCALVHFFAAAPSRPIPRGLAGLGLLAHVMVSKFCDHIPRRIARRGIYDNMKTAVDKDGTSKGRVVNSRSTAMWAHCLFDADICNVASGWE